ncbi:helix-turn-helix transcriptional regulator [Actinoallomurus acanthiterrae]
MSTARTPELSPRVYKEPVPMANSSGFVSYFGTELRRHRERLGWHRDQLADRVPWSVWTVASVEQGRRKPPARLWRTRRRPLQPPRRHDRTRQEGPGR